MGFLDDVYFVCNSVVEAQSMLNDAVCTFDAIGLSLNVAKIHWAANKYVGLLGSETLKIGRVLIPVSESLIVLGCVVMPNGDEGPALRHRTIKAWGDISISHLPYVKAF